MKTLPLKNFVEDGWLQEINRLILHPAGYALSVLVDEETGDVEFDGIIDYSDDPEGMIFEDGLLSLEKANKVDASLVSKYSARLEALGYVIQPVPLSKK